MKEDDFKQAPEPESVPGKLEALSRKVGYGLLVLSLGGYGEQFSGAHFGNALWVFQVMGDAVEKAPALLVALFFIFFAGPVSASGFERLVLKCLSWLCLVFGILFLLLMPTNLYYWTAIDDALRNQSTNEITKANVLEEQFLKATAREKEEYLKRGGVTPEALKTAARDGLSQQRKKVIVKSTKWSFGALAAGVVLIALWQTSRWARRKGQRVSYSEVYR